MQSPVTDYRAAPVATGTCLQDASNLPNLSHQQAAQPDAAEVACKARRAQCQRDLEAAMSEQQAEAVRAAVASAHKKSRSVRHKVPPAAAAGYTTLSMNSEGKLFGSGSAALQSLQQPMWPQPNAITASGLIPPGMIPMQPRG